MGLILQHKEAQKFTLGKGKVIFSGRKSGYGNIVEVLHGESVISRYAHIKKSLVKKGQRVTKKDIIALVGNTGRSTGPHLHLEIAINGETIDPEIFLIGKVAYYK
jgi:murein DD-endopeptidase MepM/ murein hydrolase activator NlpD